MIDARQERTQDRGERVTLGDFVIDTLFAAATSVGGRMTIDVSDPRVHGAMYASFKRLRELAQEQGLDPAFVIRPDQHTGISPTLEGELYSYLFWNARDTNLFSGVFAYDVEQAVLRTVLEDEPGGEALWQDLASTYLAEYQRPVVQT